MRANNTTIACALVALFSFSAHAGDPTAPPPPNLCDELLHTITGEVFSDTEGNTISRFCRPRIEPPMLDREVCCAIGSKASCKFPGTGGRCSTGMAFWCEYGQTIGAAVECYQAGPSACAAGFCDYDTVHTGTIFEDSSWVCCNIEADECTYIGEGTTPPSDSCEGSIALCDWGSLNEDNTVNCDN